mgnify:CR=1 FL=1
MRVLDVDPLPIASLPALNAAGRGAVEAVSFPIHVGRVDRLPGPLQALVAAADLQALELPDGGPQRLIGEALAERLVALADQGLLPDPALTGVLLAGDLYTVPDLARRGGLGDVRSVWEAFADRFRWAAGVLGNHDLIGSGPRDQARFQRRPGVHLLDGQVRALDGLRVGGVGGIAGDPRKPNRRWHDELCATVEAVLVEGAEVLVLHEGPDGPRPEQRGNPDLRAALVGSGLRPLVVCGHSWWPTPLVELEGGLQVLKVDARVVVLRPLE